MLGALAMPFRPRYLRHSMSGGVSLIRLPSIRKPGLAVFFCVAMLAVAATGAAARDLVNAGLRVPSIDLMSVLDKVETDKQAAGVKLPEAKGQNTLMTLEAKGPGPIYRWAVVTMLNPDPVPRDLVLVVPHQKLGGSGIFWPKPQGSRLYSLAHRGDAVVTELKASGMNAYAFRIEPGATETFAIEISPAGLQAVTLQQRMFFDAQSGGGMVERGLLLGAGLLLFIGMLTAAVMRLRLTFGAGSLFMAAAYLFLGSEAGYLPLLPDAVFSSPAIAPRVAAVSEALLAAGTCLLILTLIDLRKTHAQARHVLLAVFSSAVALAAYGLLQPELAQAAARLLFAVAATAGVVLSILRWRLGDANSRLPLLIFGAIFIWAALAAISGLAAAYAVPQELVSGLLVFAMMTVSFALLPQALGASLGSRYEDSGRRALALAGAGHTVWDWQVERGSLHVGPELDRVLGLEPGTLAKAGRQGFLELIHEADRSAYLAAIENAERRGRGAFQQRFRLRRMDGTDRWYMLRARAIPGSSGMAARLIGVLEDITELRHSEERMISDAVNDRVTGLPNRLIFLDRLETALKRARSEKGQPSGLHVLIIDIDRFKTVNEGLGHETGDNLLAVTARRLQSVLGPEDTLARLYGDQFGILFEGARPKRSVSAFVDTLRRTISRPVSLRPREVFLTASVGVVTVNEASRSAENMLKDAEVALYEAKRRGKDQVEHFRPDMRDPRADRLSVEQDLRRALERKEFEVVYQPIHRLKNGELAGFEALLRWHHPLQGELMPNDFVPVAEQAGLIGELGSFALNEAARQLGTWQRTYRNEPPLFMAVNVSSTQLLSNELLEQTEQIISREGLAHGSLRIELTEAVVLQNPELAGDVLARLKGLGAGIACDDFGTGQSSLSLLRRLAFDTLKVDRSFVAADDGDERAGIILESIVSLAHELDMSVIAEGVERLDQLERLKDMRCDYGQGFHFGEALPSRRMTEKLGGLGILKSRTPRFSWSRLIGREERADRPQRSFPPPPQRSEPTRETIREAMREVVREPQRSEPRPIAPPRPAAPQGPRPAPSLPVAPARTPLRNPAVARNPAAVPDTPRPSSPTRVRPPSPRLQVTDGQSAIELLKSFRSMMEKNDTPKKP